MKTLLQSDLKSMAQVCAEKIVKAKDNVEYFSEPYRHIVIDNFLDMSLANDCLQNFPPLEDASWEHANDTDIEVKYRTTWKSEFDIPDGIVSAVRLLNS